MRLTIRALGLDLIDVELTTDPTEPEDDYDYARDLSGGSLGSDRLEIDNTDRYMGFGNGREADD